MKLYNTLSRTIEEFVPLSPNNISLYVCGITPYDTTHLGHAFTYISFDALVRYLRHKEFRVAYTQNVTDINDRDNDILKNALEQKITWKELSQFWTTKFLEDMQALNWVKPTHYVYASEYIDKMIVLIQKILKNGFAYEKNGSVYLDISKAASYGKLSRLNTTQMKKNALEFEEDLSNPDKRNQLDITLWKGSTSHQNSNIPSFDSPFGKGRPGWHIECSTMAAGTLSEQIDIHGGGIDLIYPHHESEIAQSESATKKVPFAKYWIHTGTVYYRGKKMSKSLGNLVLVSDLLKTYSPNAIRWLLLSHQWQNQWEFFEKDLQPVQTKVDELEKLLDTYTINNELMGIGENSMQVFESFLGNNFNTPFALEYIIQVADKYKTRQDSRQKRVLYSTIGKMLEVLGFLV